MRPQTRNLLALSFVAGFAGPWFPRLSFTLLIAIILALLFKGCWRLYRLDRALQADRTAFEVGNPPRAMVTWKDELSIDKKYQLGWLASIGVVGVTLSTLPVRLSAGFIGYLFLAELMAFVFYAFKVPFSRRQFFVALGGWNARKAQAGAQ